MGYIHRTQGYQPITIGTRKYVPQSEMTPSVGGNHPLSSQSYLLEERLYNIAGRVVPDSDLIPKIDVLDIKTKRLIV